MYVFNEVDETVFARNTRKELPEEFAKQANESYNSGQGVSVTLDTAKEARSILTRLRKYANDQDRGVRAKITENDDGTATLVFKVTEKRQTRG